jgi:hypothetical protein
LVEQRIRNAKVGSSTLLTGTNQIEGPPASGPFVFAPRNVASMATAASNGAVSGFVGASASKRDC